MVLLRTLDAGNGRKWNVMLLYTYMTVHASSGPPTRLLWARQALVSRATFHRPLYKVTGPASFLYVTLTAQLENARMRSRQTDNAM